MTISTLVDTNILVDVLGSAAMDSRWWSLSALKQAFDDGPIVLSVIVWAELSSPSVPEHMLASALAWLRPRHEDLPFAAGWPAGSAQRLYRERGGKRERTLPDFLIGAHAEIAGHRLLTRDAGRYRTYFPTLDIIAPDTHP